MNNNNFDVVIVGAGVSGLLAAILITKYSNVRVGLFDQGANYAKRRDLSIHDNSVHLKGIGGAGTLEGGKLCSLPASGSLWTKTIQDLNHWESFVSHLPLNSTIKKALTDSKRKYFYLVANNTLHEKKYESILLLKEEMSRFINGLIDQANFNNVEIFDNAEVLDIVRKDSAFHLKMSMNGCCEIIANKLVLATGRQSANKIERMLINVPVEIIEQSPDLGVRIEFPKNHSVLFSRDGKDTKIKMNVSDFKLRTFCVCAGGIIAPISYGSIVYFDGQFDAKLTNRTNLGIMSRSSKLKGFTVAEDYCKAFQDNNEIIAMSDFLRFGTRLLRNSKKEKFGQVFESINYFISQLLKNNLLNNDLKDCSVLFPAIDGYNSFIKTNQNFETDCNNLFVIGDAAGVSRGYIQSLWSGWCCSNEIVAQINNLNKYDCISDQEECIKYA